MNITVDTMKEYFQDAEAAVTHYPFIHMERREVVHVPGVGYIVVTDVHKQNNDPFGIDYGANPKITMTFQVMDDPDNKTYEVDVEHNSWDGYVIFDLYEVEEYTETVKKYRRKR